MEFVVKPGGSGFYTVTIENDLLRLELGNRSPSSLSPSVYVQMRSEFLWLVGLREAHEAVVNLMNPIFKGGPEREQVSRADLFADFVLPKGSNPIDVEKIVTKAAGDDTRRSHKKISSYRVGTGDIVVRIYDKSRKARKEGKLWLFDLWGLDQSRKDVTVWRVECQLRRQALKEFGIESFEDLLNCSQAIWRYCTTDWFSMRELDSENVSRRTPTEFWRMVQAAEIKLQAEAPRIAERVRKRSGMTEKQAVDQIRGIARSHARSLQAESPALVLDRLARLAREGLN